MVWLYNNTRKSVFAVALFHAVSNVCWQSFPIHGSYFDGTPLEPTGHARDE
jgi:hypothetical protein